MAVPRLWAPRAPQPFFKTVLEASPRRANESWIKVYYTITILYDYYTILHYTILHYTILYYTITVIYIYIYIYMIIYIYIYIYIHTHAYIYLLDALYSVLYTILHYTTLYYTILHYATLYHYTTIRLYYYTILWTVGKRDPARRGSLRGYGQTFPRALLRDLDASRSARLSAAL